MSFTDRLRDVDRRAVVAYLLAAAGLVVDLRSTQTAAEGAITSCTSKDWADLVLAALAIGLGGVALATAPARNRVRNRLVAGAAVVAGIALLPTGLGWVGGPCEGGDATSPVIVLLAGLVVVAAIASSSPTATAPAAVAAAAVDERPGPDLSAGLRRCRACMFSSNPLDATACRLCGSTDLVAVVPTGTGGFAPDGGGPAR
jgi:hypothetical protein